MQGLQGFDFLTADSHFNHSAMIEKEVARHRFESVEEMNEVLIKRWNEDVFRRDVVIHLGDLGFVNAYRTESEMTKILSRLKGQKKLIPGNHDSKEVLRSAVAAGFELLNPLEVIKVNRKELYLCHYPIEVGGSSRRFSLHGHIHSQDSTHWNQLNVGVEAPDTPEFGRLYSNADIHRLIYKRMHP